MNLQPPFPRRLQPAFTLVELLTVIAIIAILMALLFPALSIMWDRARRAQATTDCMAVVTAAKAFQADYGKYPNPFAAVPATPVDAIVGDTVGGATAGSDNLCNILRAIPAGTNVGHALNPRRVVFFEGRMAKDQAKPKNGFGPSGAFFDPWGAQYCIALDLDGDNQLTTLPYTDFNGATKGPRIGVGTYSLGKDGKLGIGGSYQAGSDKSDDLISWQ